MEAFEPKKALPDIEAVPPTSRVVSVNAPALTANREFAPVNSNLSEPEALAKEK